MVGGKESGWGRSDHDLRMGEPEMEKDGSVAVVTGHQSAYGGRRPAVAGRAGLAGLAVLAGLAGLGELGNGQPSAGRRVTPTQPILIPPKWHAIPPLLTTLSPQSRFSCMHHASMLFEKCVAIPKCFLWLCIFSRPSMHSFLRSLACNWEHYDHTFHRRLQLAVGPALFTKQPLTQLFDRAP